MSIIIDIVLIAIFAVSAYFAAKKGLVGTLFSLLSTVAAIVLSLILSTTVSGFIDNQFVRPAVKSYILGVIDSSSVGSSYDKAIESIDVAGKIENMPSELKNVLELAGVDSGEIVKKANEMSANSAAAKDELINSIAGGISGTISRVIALIVLFVVLSIALGVAAKLITAVFNAIPVTRGFNRIGGLVFGILRGLIIVFAVSTLFTAVSKGVSPTGNSIFSKKTIDSTYVLRGVSDINPINSMLNIK